MRPDSWFVRVFAARSLGLGLAMRRAFLHSINEWSWLPVVLVVSFIPRIGFACACGCGLFDVATSSVLPTSVRSTAYLQYSFMNQNQNWHSSSKAEGGDNEDQEIRTSFVTLGAQMMLSRAWGLRAELPYWSRSFTTLDEDTSSSMRFAHGALADIKLEGVYSGLSDDMSTGFMFGLKLPTGDSKYNEFDRDTQIGTGSLDILLGAYHLGELLADPKLNWFLNFQWQQALLVRDAYRPGAEADLSLGVYLKGWEIGAETRLSPIAQILTAYRLKDGGADGNPADSGYIRSLFAPGIELSRNEMRVNADVAVPVYTWVRGNQLVAPLLYKLTLSTQF